MGNKLLYAMEHADKILVGVMPSIDWRDILTGIFVAVLLKILIWQKRQMPKSSEKESSMDQPDGGRQRISSLTCRMIPG